MQGNDRCYSEVEIRTNMKDAGFDENDIDMFIFHLNAGNKAKAFQILKKHRKQLLNRLHMAQDCINCVDYLSYRITNE